MTSKPMWTDSIGLETIKQVVSRRIPQWPNGLREHQEAPISMVLNKEHLLLFTGTGSGKSAIFYIPLIIHHELSEHPDNYPSFPVCKNAVGIVITPTKGLANSIIHDIESFGLRGLSYCRETISEYRINKKLDLVQLVCECRSWDLICVDPEHLATPEWREIMQNTNFKQHLVLFCVDEAHLIRRWAPNFRPAFNDIGALARGYLPETVPIIALTATCAPGHATAELCQSLGLVGKGYHLIRHSNERKNMHIILETLKSIPGASKYHQLLNYLRSGRKSVIHVNTIPAVYDIYEFLWHHIPEGHSPLHRMRMYHALCTDEYNRETFRLIDSDPKLQIVIATVGFSQGINCSAILDSISWGFPSTLDEFWQAKGRSGRASNVICRGIAIVSIKTIKSAQEFANASNHGTTSISKTKFTTKIADMTMERGKAGFLVETQCHVAFLNSHYGNPPLEISILDCKEAGRKIFCNLCAIRYHVTYSFAPPCIPSPSLSWLPLVVKSSSQAAKKRKSAKYLGKDERNSMRQWMIDFRELVWCEFQPKDRALCNYPLSWFFPDKIINDILENFLIIDSLDALTAILNTHSWKFTEHKSESLFRLLTEFQIFIHTQRAEMTTERDTKKQTRTGKNQKLISSDSDIKVERHLN
ncbi:hypothetical protein K435DRAFT_860768 [Dendrothele bispora CBS 962.96]|uniref:DNA 3'-5' helicase n=1 Tax=Dendrothele bispora (strain CBS 962.96) TaxID=1314807 RepID=A0A4S8LX39_DENBC|nr:hypothetical protein K435DRAFT_860768 [Dendrothele bispora CBS 962.96]